MDHLPSGTFDYILWMGATYQAKMARPGSIKQHPATQNVSRPLSNGPFWDLFVRNPWVSVQDTLGRATARYDSIRAMANRATMFPWGHDGAWPRLPIMQPAHLAARSRDKGISMNWIHNLGKEGDVGKRPFTTPSFSTASGRFQRHRFARC